jgi:hypothetical protein
VHLAAGGASQAGSGPIATATFAPDYGLGNGPTLSPSTWMKANGQIEFHIVDATARKPCLRNEHLQILRGVEADRAAGRAASQSQGSHPAKAGGRLAPYT